MSIQDFFTYLIKYMAEQSSGISIKELLISWAIGCILVHLCFLIYSRITGKKRDWIKELLWYLIIGYLCFGSQITLWRRAAGSRTTVVLELDLGSLFGDFYSMQQFFYSLLNVLFFIPWGFLLGLYRNDIPAFRRIIVVVSYSILTSIAIEVAQLLTQRGNFEVSDIITNTTGGLIGGLIACMLIAVLCALFKDAGKREENAS